MPALGSLQGRDVGQGELTPHDGALSALYKRRFACPYRWWRAMWTTIASSGSCRTWTNCCAQAASRTSSLPMRSGAMPKSMEHHRLSGGWRACGSLLAEHYDATLHVYSAKRVFGPSVSIWPIRIFCDLSVDMTASWISLRARALFSGCSRTPARSSCAHWLVSSCSPQARRMRMAFRPWGSQIQPLWMSPFWTAPASSWIFITPQTGFSCAILFAA